ncbi:hypothetical protein D1BOALGB6SA_10763 [Olavius sp. associated proteobacterium Delta 1]|nr:hypothetical protein D1BOALGB6SA_10763 [Olavius sp. associated proteobacterium Delta 1]
MEKDLKYSQHTYSYLVLRKAIGWIGILLPFTLMLGAFLIFREELAIITTLPCEMFSLVLSVP